MERAFLTVVSFKMKLLDCKLPGLESKSNKQTKDYFYSLARWSVHTNECNLEAGPRERGVHIIHTEAHSALVQRLKIRKAKGKNLDKRG